MSDYEALFRRRRRESPEIPDHVAEWIEANPLRQWRKERELSFRKLDRLIADEGLTPVPAIASLCMWEQGRVIPNERNLCNIAAIMGEDPMALASEWAAWYDRKPDGWPA